MNKSELQSFLRRVDQNKYPELKDYSWYDIYGNGDQMAPGGMFLASLMSRSLNLSPDDLVLDIGCGNGDSSIFLVKHFGVRVVAVDLWKDASVLAQKFIEHEVSEQIIPLRLDVTKPLPFANNYFDAVFCMQTWHYFGAEDGFLAHLFPIIKTGAQLCIGNTCFNKEVPIPDIYKNMQRWESEYGRYHSPEWWGNLFTQSKFIDLQKCEEIEDGIVFWEDEQLFMLENSNWNQKSIERGQNFFKQLKFGRENEPYLTHYVATMKRNATDITMP